MRCLLDLNKCNLSLCFSYLVVALFRHLVVAVFRDLVVAVFSCLATVNGWQRRKILQLRAKRNGFKCNL